MADGAPSVRAVSNGETSAFHQEGGVASCVFCPVKRPTDSGSYSSRA